MDNAAGLVKLKSAEQSQLHREQHAQRVTRVEHVAHESPGWTATESIGCRPVRSCATEGHSGYQRRQRRIVRRRLAHRGWLERRGTQRHVIWRLRRRTVSATARLCISMRCRGLLRARDIGAHSSAVRRPRHARRRPRRLIVEERMRRDASLARERAWRAPSTLRVLGWAPYKLREQRHCHCMVNQTGACAVKLKVTADNIAQLRADFQAW